MIPITRKELYLNKIVGNDDYSVPEKPISEEEFFFAEILGEAVQAPEPLTRYQMYLAKIAGKDVEIPYPETRLEYFLARAAGMEIETPTPITREEIYWSNYTATTEFELDGVPPLAYKAIEGTLTNYRIYGNTVDGESVGDRTANLFANLWKKGYIRADNGREEQIDGFICSGFFPVEYGQTYSISRNINVGYDNVRGYRDDGSFIGAGTTVCDVDNPFPSGATKIGAFTVTNENVAFIRFNDSANDLGMKYMIVEGTYTEQTMPDYEPYGYKVPVTVEHSAPHTATLQLHDCLPSTMQFDAPEALYYAENGLTAGTYNFTIQASYGDGKTYQFTLANDVPAKGQLVFDWTYDTQASAAKITSYASSTSTTAIEQVGVTEGRGGTSLGTTDGNSTNVNHIHRARYGSNNYKESAIRQFLNSSAVAGSVWTPQTKYDRPPSWNSNTAGFMKDIDSDFLAVLGASPKVVALNTVTDGGGSVTINNDKFFLLSCSEIYGGKENNINEGEPYPYYSNYSDRSEASIGDDSNRIKYRSGTAQMWWLRSPGSAGSSIVRYVNASGNVCSYTNANSSSGVAPACNIALDEDYKFNGQVLHVRDQISVTKGNQTLVFDVIGIDHDEVHFDKTTTNLYLPEQIKMVGDEAEYIDYAEQKMHRIGADDVDVTLPALPTIAGTNVLSVGTAVQPSNVYIKYKGAR